MVVIVVVVSYIHKIKINYITLHYITLYIIHYTLYITLHYITFHSIPFHSIAYVYLYICVYIYIYYAVNILCIHGFKFYEVIWNIISHNGLWAISPFGCGSIPFCRIAESRCVNANVFAHSVTSQPRRINHDLPPPPLCNISKVISGP